MRLPDESELNEVAVLIHGPAINLYRYRNHPSYYDREKIRPTTWSLLTPAEKKGVLMYIEAAKHTAMLAQIAENTGMSAHAIEYLSYEKGEGK